MTEDEKLEIRINTALNDVLLAVRMKDARTAFCEFSNLIAQRSPERVLQMERERNLL